MIRITTKPPSKITPEKITTSEMKLNTLYISPSTGVKYIRASVSSLVAFYQNGGGIEINEIEDYPKSPFLIPFNDTIEISNA